MAWFNLGELDPETLEYKVCAYGVNAENFQKQLDNDVTPTAEKKEIELRLERGVPKDASFLGIKEFEELAGSATPEELRDLEERLEELGQDAQEPIGRMSERDSEATNFQAILGRTALANSNK